MFLNTGGAPVIRVSSDGQRISASGPTSWGEPGDGSAGWQWDGSELRAWAGDGGAPLLYLGSRPDGITVSPSLAAIAHLDRPALDRLAWTTFQYLGYFVGEDTPFRDIRALAPAAMVVFNRAGLQRSAPRPVYDSEPPSPNSLERFQALMDRSVRRAAARSEGAVRVELSAGLDSRHVLGQLRASGVDVAECVTSFKYPPDDLDETALARCVADQVGVPWRMVPSPQDRVSAEISAAHVQGLCSDGGAWSLFRADPSFAPTGPTVWYSGTGGDALTGRLPGGAWLQAPGSDGAASASVDDCVDRGNFAEAARMLLARSRRARTLLPLLARRFDITLAPLDAVVERVAAEIEVHRRAGDPLAAFLLWNGVRRNVVPAVTGLLRPGDAARLPFMDGEVVHFLLSLAPRRRYRGFHQAAIAAYPFTAIPTASDAPPARSRRQTLHAFAHVTQFHRDLAPALYALGGPSDGLFADVAALESPRQMALALTNALQWLMTCRWLDGAATPDWREAIAAVPR